ACLTDRNAGTDRRRHRFLDQENVARAGALRRLLDGATLDLGGAAWHTYQNPGARSEHARAMHLANELLEHLLGHGKVGDDAILQRSYRDDVARRSAQHLLGVRAHCGDAARAARSAVLPNRNHRWLVEDDSLPANVNQGVGRAEVDRQVVGKEATQTFEHGLNRTLKRGVAKNATV